MTSIAIPSGDYTMETSQTALELLKVVKNEHKDKRDEIIDLYLKIYNRIRYPSSDQLSEDDSRYR